MGKNIYNIFEVWAPGASWAPAGALFTFSAPAGALSGGKNIIYFFLFGPHFMRSGPQRPDGRQLGPFPHKKIEHDFHDKNNKRNKIVDTKLCGSGRRRRRTRRRS